MFIIADGMVKGAGNDDYTPDIILKILNPERSRTPLAKSYQALGEAMLQLNFAKVYFGHHISAVGNSVPYIVINSN